MLRQHADASLVKDAEHGNSTLHFAVALKDDVSALQLLVEAGADYRCICRV